MRAAQEVIDGKLDDEFPLVVFQTGSGTQTNMNANEVIANRAIQLAGGVVGLEEADPSERRRQPQPVVQRHLPDRDAHRHGRADRSNVLMPAVRALRDTLDGKAQAFADVVMVGRTHLQDATPLTLGQVISGWVAQLDQALAGIERALPGVLRAGDRRHRGRHRAERRIRASARWRRGRSRRRPASRSSRRRTSSPPCRRTTRW